MTESGSNKVRIDRFLVELNLAESREQARKLVMAGLVLVDDRCVSKPGTLVSKTASIRVRDKLHPFVSRGGVKLQHALDHFNISVDGIVALDVGVSTGGFTDCLLQRGASRIYAIDVGYGQIDWKLRNDLRVTLHERTNVRYLTPGHVPERIDLVVIDVSFISLTLVLPVIRKLTGSPVLSLVKPQFEVGKHDVGKGGIVRDKLKQEAAVKKIMEFSREIGYSCVEPFLSPVMGAKGNREYFIYLKLGAHDGF